MVRTWIIKEDLFPSQKKKSYFFLKPMSRLNAIAFVKLKSRFLEDHSHPLMLFSLQVLCKAAAPLWPLGFRGCFLGMAVPWLQHQRTSERGSPSAPGGLWVLLAHPDEMAGQWPVWPRTTSSTTATSTRLSTRAYPDRCGLCIPHPQCPLLACLCGACRQPGRRCPFSSSVFAGMAPLLSQLEVRLFWRTAGPLGEWGGNCCPAAPVVTGVCLSWSFALNCQQMCRLWISIKQLHNAM